MIRDEPLSTRMRPTSLDEVVGQQEVIGPATALYRMIQNGHVPSMLFYGAPGTGKTSLAYAIAGTTGKQFYALNATTSGKKEIESIIAEVSMTRNAIVFIDEIHRFNKAQQDSLLKALEEGVFSLIGATTENPFHSVNSAIRSRCGQIRELRSLSREDVYQLLRNALENKLHGLGGLKISISDAHLEMIASTTGDGRIALNLLENIVWASKGENEDIVVTKEAVEQCIENIGFTHDKKGDIYYSLLSCLQKSIRGSDVDAALYYLARLIEGGDAVSIARRLLVIAYEDVGLANPDLCSRVLPAIQSVERLGFPEGRIPLAVITIEMCLSAKSNSAYLALDKAIEDVRKGNTGEIPNHLRDAHYPGANILGHGVGYKYPHDYPNAWVNQAYLPQELEGTRYYLPKDSGEEKRFSQIHQKLKLLRNTTASK